MSFLTALLGNLLFLISLIICRSLLILRGVARLYLWNIVVANVGVAIYIGSTIESIAKKKYPYSNSFCIFSKLWLKVFVTVQLCMMMAYDITLFSRFRKPLYLQQTKLSGCITVCMIWCAALTWNIASFSAQDPGNRNISFYTTVYQCSVTYNDTSVSQTVSIRKVIGRMFSIEFIVLAVFLVAHGYALTKILRTLKEKGRKPFRRFVMRCGILFTSFVPLTLVYQIMSMALSENAVNSEGFAILYRISKNLPYLYSAYYPLAEMWNRDAYRVYGKQLLRRCFSVIMRLFHRPNNENILEELVQLQKIEYKPVSEMERGDNAEVESVKEANAVALAETESDLNLHAESKLKAETKKDTAKKINEASKAEASVQVISKAEVRARAVTGVEIEEESPGRVNFLEANVAVKTQKAAVNKKVSFEELSEAKAKAET